MAFSDTYQLQTGSRASPCGCPAEQKTSSAPAAALQPNLHQPRSVEVQGTLARLLGDEDVQASAKFQWNILVPGRLRSAQHLLQELQAAAVVRVTLLPSRGPREICTFRFYCPSQVLLPIRVLHVIQITYLIVCSSAASHQGESHPDFTNYCCKFLWREAKP